MKSKIEYSKPCMEIIQLEQEEIIAQSPPSLNQEEEHEGGAIRARKFWVE